MPKGGLLEESCDVLLLDRKNFWVEGKKRFKYLVKEKRDKGSKQTPLAQLQTHAQNSLFDIGRPTLL
jgi:hypothetical protein